MKISCLAFAIALLCGASSLAHAGAANSPYAEWRAETKIEAHNAERAGALMRAHAEFNGWLNKTPGAHMLHETMILRYKSAGQGRNATVEIAAKKGLIDDATVKRWHDADFIFSLKHSGE